jgi:hypothetical protein
LMMMSSFNSITVTPLLTAHHYNQSPYCSLITGYASHQRPQGTYGPCLTLCKILLTFGVRVVNEIVKPRCPMRHQARFQ